MSACPRGKCPISLRASGALPCAEIHDEVDFQLLKVELAVLPLALDFDDADVHVAAAGNELVEDDVLHQVRLFGFAEVEPGVAQSHVRRVELLGIGQVFLAAYVVAFGLAEEIGLLEIVEVFLQRPVGRPGKALGTECQDELVRICQRPYRGCQYIYDCIHNIKAFNTISFHYIRNIGLFK